MARPRGDWKKLDKILRASGRIVSKELLRRSARAFGETTFRLAKQGAQEGKNPFGRRWRRLKKTRGIALRSVAGSLRLRVRSIGFDVQTSKPWARYQNFGASKRGTKWRLPKRGILPKKSLPKPWREAVVSKLEAEWYGNFGKD